MKELDIEPLDLEIMMSFYSTQPQKIVSIFVSKKKLDKLKAKHKDLYDFQRHRFNTKIPLILAKNI